LTIVASSPGRYPTEKERGRQMYHPDFDYGLGRERVVQMRNEVELNRLKSRLAKAAGLSEESGFRRSMVTRGTTFVTALFK
jgi:hypothetical protein